VYWCERSESSVGEHLKRICLLHPDQITIIASDLSESPMLSDLAKAWGLSCPLQLELSEEQTRKRCESIEAWTSDCHLTGEEQEVAYGWMLVQVGLFAPAARLLVCLSHRAEDEKTIMLATLFAGYAYREMSMHIPAQRYLRRAAKLARECCDEVRALQAEHKLIESRSSFERLSLWHFFPGLGVPWQPASQSEVLIKSYKGLAPDQVAGKELGRAGLGDALMNAGQFYRRVGAYWKEVPWLGPALARPLLETSKKLLKEAEKELYGEGNVRSLAMVTEASAAMEPDDEKAKLRFRRAIEYAEKWNQDSIQVGSAHFNMAEFLKDQDPAEAEKHLRLALDAYLDANMEAEIARTWCELWLAASRWRSRAAEAKDYRMLWAEAMRRSQGSRTWKILYPLMMWFKYVIMRLKHLIMRLKHRSITADDERAS